MRTHSLVKPPSLGLSASVLGACALALSVGCSASNGNVGDDTGGSSAAGHVGSGGVSNNSAGGTTVQGQGGGTQPGQGGLTSTGQGGSVSQLQGGSVSSGQGGAGPGSGGTNAGGATSAAGGAQSRGGMTSAQGGTSVGGGGASSGGKAQGGAASGGRANGGTTSAGGAAMGGATMGGATGTGGGSSSTTCPTAKTGGTCPAKSCPTGASDCGCYTVAGLGARKKVILDAGGDSRFLASAMVETENLKTDYAHGDNKTGDAFNAGCAKQNWYMTRQCHAAWNSLKASDYETSSAMNTDLKLDITVYNECRAKWDENHWFAGHRNGQTGLQTGQAPNLALFIAASKWTQTNLENGHMCDDVRFWATVPAIIQ